MNRDVMLIIFGWLITIILLLLFVPKNKIREATVIFFFKQFITWVSSLTVTELKLVEHPIHSFPYSTKTSFDFEFFIYPSFCVLFNLYYPEKKGFFGQFMYYFYYCTSLTIIEVIVERHTNILNYLNWTWYMTWLTFYITFYASRKYYLWFYKIKGTA